MRPINEFPVSIKMYNNYFFSTIYHTGNRFETALIFELTFLLKPKTYFWSTDDDDENETGKHSDNAENQNSEPKIPAERHAFIIRLEQHARAEHSLRSSLSNQLNRPI